MTSPTVTQTIDREKQDVSLGDQVEIEHSYRRWPDEVEGEVVRVFKNGSVDVREDYSGGIYHLPPAGFTLVFRRS